MPGGVGGQRREPLPTLLAPGSNPGLQQCPDQATLKGLNIILKYLFPVIQPLQGCKALASIPIFVLNSDYLLFCENIPSENQLFISNNDMLIIISLITNIL